MATPYVTVNVVAELLDHDHGHWCNTCLLSSGIRAWVALRVGGRMQLEVRLHCHQCGGLDIKVDPDARHC